MRIRRKPWARPELAACPFCINDPEKDVDFASISKRLREAFEMILPEKSGFEK